MSFDWEKYYKGSPTWLPSRTIFLTRFGSHAYGTNTEESDLDFRGVCVAPREYYLGFSQRFEQVEVEEPADLLVYDVRKFFRLAAVCNPNVVEMLFTHPQDWLITRPYAANRLLQNRELFLSKRAKHSFLGYASSQMRDLTKEYAKTGRYRGKTGMQLVRLLRSGVELLTKKTITVRRPDAEELLAIRGGAWSFEQLRAWFDRQVEEIKEAAERSTLPEEADVEALDNLCANIIEEALC